MKELYNEQKVSIVNNYPKINIILNDIYLDLITVGFSKDFCLLEQYYYAKQYVCILTKHTRLYGLTEDEVEAQFNLKAMRKAFACNNIDIDVLLNACNYQPTIDVRPQILNLHLCTDDTTEEEHIVPFTVLGNDENNYFTTDENNVLTFEL